MPDSTLPFLVDCHAHLADPVFDADRDQVLARAEAAGIGAVVTVGETLEEARRVLALADVEPRVRAAAGLYPIHLDLQQARRVESFIRDHRDRLCAIGEVGLDHWKIRDDAERAIQKEIFRGFIRLSVELSLPLNVHSRSAGRQTVVELLESGAERVQLHAFDGKPSAARPGVEAGFFFSIPPSIVRSRQKQKLVRRLPLSCLLLETDSPVLSPVPGERNEPANLRIALRAIAEIKKSREEEIAEAIAENTARLYGKLISSAGR
jgi:TatD DNase family protein